MEEKLVLRPEEAARALDIGRSKLYQLIARGEIESFTIGSRRVIPKDALLSYIER